jgi:catechol 2,3-dioxygenase-like lactoylglutathione lyase family enzyme
MESETYPALRQTVLDTTNARELAEFYRRLLGYRYADGDEPTEDGADDADWLTLVDDAGVRHLAFQRIERSPEATWPDGPVPQQLHLDFLVTDTNELATQHDRALALGARVLRDESADADEPLWVFADPAGHPFCIFVEGS